MYPDDLPSVAIGADWYCCRSKRPSAQVYVSLGLDIADISLGGKSLHFRMLGAVSIKKTVLPGMAIPMLKIRRPNGRLIFNMEITIRR